MLHLTCLPVGQSASDMILPRACKQDRERTMVVTASGILVRKARLAGLNAANFDYLANDILRQCGRTGVRLLSRKAQELVLQEVLETLQKQGKLPYFVRLWERKGFLRSMASLMGELGRSGVTVEELEFALTSWDRDNGAGTVPGAAGIVAGAFSAANYRQKDAEVALIYKTYRTRLKEHSVYDVEGLYRLAAASLAGADENTAAGHGQEAESNVFHGQGENPRKLKWDTLYFIGFYHFDALEINILKLLARFCEVWVVLPYEEGRPELYGATKLTYEELMGLPVRKEAAAMGNPLPEPVRSPALTHLLETLRKDLPCVYPADGTVEIWETVDRTEEMRAVLRHIKELAVLGKVRPCESAVVVRDLNAYSGFVSLCGEYGIPVNLPQSASLSANPLFVFLRLALAAAGKKGRRKVEAWLELLRQPLLSVLFGMDAGEAEKLASDRYYTDVDSLLTKLATLPGRDGMQELFGQLRALPDKAAAAEYEAVLAALLDLLQVQRRLGEAYRKRELTLAELKNMACGEAAIRSLLQGLARDCRSCGQEQTVLQSEAFADALTEAALSVNIVLQAGNEQGLSVLTASSPEDMRYRYVYVLGLVEGEFPFYKNENWIYSDSERAILKELGVELPDSAAGRLEDVYFFVNACAAATEHLILTYFRGEDETPSFYVDEVLALFSGLTVQKKMPALQEDAVLSRREMELALARSGDMERLRAMIAADAGEGNRTASLPDAVQGAARKQRCKSTALFRSAPRGLTDAALTDRERLTGGQNYNGQLSDQELIDWLHTLLGSNYSASQLETYLNCPFRFLVTYGWHKQEAEQVEEDLDAGRRGTLLHRALERFIRGHLKETLAEAGEERLRSELDVIFDGICREEEEQGRIYAGPFWEKDKERQRRLLHRWLTREIAYSRRTKFRPVAVEQRFGGAAGRILFRAGDRDIMLNGQIDRIDSDGRQLFITDYKSGRVPAGNAFLQSDLQMPLYILAAVEQSRPQGETVAGGGYYSLKKSRREKSFIFQGSEAALPVKTFSEVRLPEAEEKTPLGSVDELRQGMQTLVAGLLRRMDAGDFAPTPSDGCNRFCPAADICRFCILQNREEENGHGEG